MDERKDMKVIPVLDGLKFKFMKIEVYTPT
jgi:hypothetical protein